MIDPAEHYLQIYEALDTVAEDVAQLAQTQAELLEMADTAEQRVIVATEVAADQRLISQRRDYALRSVLGNTATTRADIQIAGIEYVNKHKSPEAQESAARKVRVYNLLLDTVKRNGEVPSRADEISLDPTEYRTKQPTSRPSIRLHGRIDPQTGGMWYDLNNPRTVEYTNYGGSMGDKVVTAYAVKEQTTSDTGETTVVAINPSSHEADIKVALTDDSRTWRMNPAGKLELYIPAGSASLSESSPYTIERQLNSSNEAAQVAVQATGANIPNIIESFEHPDHANPIPLNVPKTS